MSCEYVLSQKGHNLLSFQGCLFSKTSEKNGRSYWLCTMKKNRCRSSLVVEEGQIVSTPKEHNHPLSPSLVKARKVQNKVKEAARLTRDPPSTVISESITGVEEVILAKIPHQENLKQTIRRIRGCKFIIIYS